MPKQQDTSIVTPSDVLMIRSSKEWIHRGQALSPAQIKVLKAEAESIVNTSLWKMMVIEGKYHAQKRAIIDTAVDDDAKALSILRKAQAFHEVVYLFEQFVMNITKK